MATFEGSGFLGRIIPVSKWVITMVSCCPLSRVDLVINGGSKPLN